MVVGRAERELKGARTAAGRFIAGSARSAHDPSSSDQEAAP
jgi:hypothetical protein